MELAARAATEQVQVARMDIRQLRVDVAARVVTSQVRVDMAARAVTNQERMGRMVTVQLRLDRSQAARNVQSATYTRRNPDLCYEL